MIPGVKNIHDACKLLQAAAFELRDARHDIAVEVLGTVCQLLGGWIAKITIEHSRRQAVVL